MSKKIMFWVNFTGGRGDLEHSGYNPHPSIISWDWRQRRHSRQWNSRRSSGECLYIDSIILLEEADKLTEAARSQLVPVVTLHCHLSGDGAYSQPRRKWVWLKAFHIRMSAPHGSGTFLEEKHSQQRRPNYFASTWPGFKLPWILLLRRSVPPEEKKERKKWCCYEHQHGA